VRFAWPYVRVQALAIRGHDASDSCRTDATARSGRSYSWMSAAAICRVCDLAFGERGVGACRSAPPATMRLPEQMAGVRLAVAVGHRTPDRIWAAAP
jgi:hypothetical protein